MEERNLELDDDGKIRLKKSGASPDDEGADEDEIVIRVPDFPGLEEEEEENTSEEELLRRSSGRIRRWKRAKNCTAMRSANCAGRWKRCALPACGSGGRCSF